MTDEEDERRARVAAIPLHLVVDFVGTAAEVRAHLIEALQKLDEVFV